jgi:hypothetical protein
MARKEGQAVKKTMLYLDEQLHKAIRHAAIEEGLPVTRLFERLAREYLAGRKKRKEH